MSFSFYCVEIRDGMKIEIMFYYYSLGRMFISGFTTQPIQILLYQNQDQNFLRHSEISCHVRRWHVEAFLFCWAEVKYCQISCYILLLQSSKQRR